MSNTDDATPPEKPDEPVQINAARTEADSAPPPAPKSRILGRADIIDADDLNSETVEVPEWGGAVIVRALTGSERDAYEAGIFASGLGKTGEYNLQNIRAKLAARTMVDESGRRLFKDDEVATLGLKSAAALDRVFAAAQRLSGLTKNDLKELTDQLTKDLSVGSGSDSPAS